MKYLSIYTPASQTTGQHREEHMAAMANLIEESMKSGILLATGGLMPVAQGGARVRRTGDRIAVVDGPFVETKEVTGGFAILQANSREEVIEMTKRFLKVAGDGEAELHQIMEP
ncbi:MAG: YciI family protein [Bryobacteraceae bacterium]